MDFNELSAFRKMTEARINNVARMQSISESVGTSATLASKKRLGLAAHALTEFKSMSKIVDVVFKNVPNDNKVASLPFFKNVDAALGDVTRVKHYDDVKVILSHIALGSNSGARTDKNVYAAAVEIQTLLSNLERNKGIFKKAIQQESVEGNREIVLSYFRSLCFLVFSSANNLYSSCLKADINNNMTPPLVDSFYFVWNEDMETAIRTIADINSTFRSGKAITAITGALREALEDGQDKALSEGVIDTAFGLITHFKVLDALVLLPIYLIRMVTYWILFSYESIKNLHNDIADTRRIIEKRSVSESEYDDYVRIGQAATTRSDQAIKRADDFVSLNSANDKKELSAMQSSNVLI